MNIKNRDIPHLNFGDAWHWLAGTARIPFKDLSTGIAELRVNGIIVFPTWFVIVMKLWNFVVNYQD